MSANLCQFTLILTCLIVNEQSSTVSFLKHLGCDTQFSHLNFYVWSFASRHTLKIWQRRALHILLTDHHLRRRVRRWRQDDGVRRRQRETAGGAEVGGQRGVGSKCFWVLSVCGCMSSLTLKSSSAGGQTLLTHHRLGSCHMLTHTVKQKLIRQHADEGTDILRNVQPHTCTTQTQACTCLAYNTRFLIKLNLVFHSDQTFFFFSWDIYVK